MGLAAWIAKATKLLSAQFAGLVYNGKKLINVLGGPSWQKKKQQLNPKQNQQQQ